ncbi:MAG: hypothetical protein AB2689_25745 [Candidatus Thiodiazotropha taylori]|nr:hypothetical protein [Candidatus Thiodiazotropha taylori]MCW4315766.1 hypothetical protein [Candidatus Thiodiazotropha taylori]
MGRKRVDIKLEYGDIQFQLVHTMNGFDDDPSNDVVTIIPVQAYTGSNVIPYMFERGPAHALTAVGNGRKGAELKITIEKLAVKAVMEVDKNRWLKDTVIFNVY